MFPYEFYDASFFAYAIDYYYNFKWDHLWGLERIFRLVSGYYKHGFAFKRGKPSKPSDNSAVAERASHDKWEHSRIGCLMVMKYTMEKSIRQSIPETNNAMEFLKAVGEKFK